MAATLIACSLWFLADRSYHPDLIFRERSPYGLVSVLDMDGYRTLVSGQVEHGGQFLDSQRALMPNGYYVSGSGAALAIQAARDRLKNAGQRTDLHMGVIGLGTGSLLTWASPNDAVRFYEIDPVIERVAHSYFSYLDHWSSQVKLVTGDGRIQLAKELKLGGPNQFDIVFIDAFTSDSIPVHLLTDECFELYRKHLKPGGILAAHITNRFVDLRAVVYHLAKKHGWTPILIDCGRDSERNGTRWVLMTSDDLVAQSPAIRAAATPWPDDLKEIIWTDDHAPVAAVVQWTGKIQWEQLLERHRRKKADSKALVSKSN
jgi:hypothetical protein